MEKKKQLQIKRVGGNSFVGVKIENDEIVLYVPKALKINVNDRRTIFTFLKTLDLIRRSKDTYLADKIDYLNGDIHSYPIESYKFILSSIFDLNNIKNRHVEYSILGNGQIAWHKTFVKGVPFIAHNNFIYPDLYRKKVVVEDKLLDEIYNRCIYEAIDNFGSWYYNMSINGKNIKNNVSLTRLKGKYLDYLDRANANTFDDDYRHLLRHMRQIISSVPDKENSGMRLLGIANYNKAFEKMVDSLFSNTKDIKETFFPKSSWSKDGKALDLNQKGLEEDTIRIEEDTLYIFDSKLYAPEKYDEDKSDKEKETFPGASDINKQITYGEYVCNMHDEICKEANVTYNKDKIYNIFIMPKPLNSVYKNNYDFIVDSGFIASMMHRQGKSFDNVYVLYIDLNQLIDVYCNNREHDVLDSALKVVNDVITKQNFKK